MPLRLLLCCLLLISTTSSAQLTVFGEWSFNVGTNLRPQAGEEFGFTAHGMCGIQYWVVALELGGGMLRLPLPEYRSRPFGRTVSVDLLSGIALRIPIGKALLIAGIDVSDVLPRRFSIYQPHIDLLFSNGKRHRGVFVKTLLYDNESWSGYIGVGVKMTLQG